MANFFPNFSKDGFPAHFRSGPAHPLPIDFSALRYSELHGGAHPDDAPTPIGSQKGPGQGAMLMEMAQLENNGNNKVNTNNDQHQGAFRRVLRRTRRNSNSQQAATVAARTTSPPGIGLGEKRRWDAPPLVEQQQLGTAAAVEQPSLEAMPIAARTRGSLLMGMLGGGGGEQNNKFWINPLQIHGFPLVFHRIAQANHPKFTVPG